MSRNRRRKSVAVYTTGGPGVPSEKVSISQQNVPVYNSYTGESMPDGVPYLGQLINDGHGGQIRVHGGIKTAGGNIMVHYEPPRQ